MIHPDFKPFPLINGGHRQTLAAFLIKGKRQPYQAIQHTFDLDAVDRTILHDDCPPGWTGTSPVVLLLHGLAGCHGSDYMVRIASKLNQQGVRTFRMDHRDCGAARGMSQLPYHAGKSEDLLAAWELVRRLCPDSPGGVIGFSLGGNVVVKATGSYGWSTDDTAGPCCAVAVNPPIDLAQCSQALSQWHNRIYDKHFVKLLIRDVQRRLANFPSSPKPQWTTLPRTLGEFDELYTAPAAGFNSAADYYAGCSGNQYVESIQIPTLILTAENDPIVPPDAFRKLPKVPGVTVHIASSGGHLGYIGRKGTAPDRRWMDWRVVQWLMPFLTQRRILNLSQQ